MRGSKTLDRLLDTRMLGAGAALKLLGAAALVGALRVIEPLDLLETSATWAVFHGVVVAGLIAAVAALATWPQLLFGPIQPRLARGAIVLLFGGGGLLVLADLISGFIADDPDLMALALDGNAALNVVTLIGSLLVAAGLAVALFGVASALKPSAAADSEAAGSESA